MSDMERADCHFSSRLGALCDGEVLAPERMVLESHIAVCSSCAGQLERQRGLARLLAASRGAASPPRILERLAREIAWVGAVRLAQVLSLAAAAVFILCTSWISFTQPAPSSLQTVSFTLKNDSSTAEGDDPVVQELMKEYANEPN
jgi:anti-sigma factor RsiW